MQVLDDCWLFLSGVSNVEFCAGKLRLFGHGYCTVRGCISIRGQVNFQSDGIQDYESQH